MEGLDEERLWQTRDVVANGLHTALLCELRAQGVKFGWLREVERLTIETVAGPLRLDYVHTPRGSWLVRADDVLAALECYTDAPHWKRRQKWQPEAAFQRLEPLTSGPRVSRVAYARLAHDAVDPHPEFLKLLWAVTPRLRRRACVVLWVCVRRWYGRDVAACAARALWALRLDDAWEEASAKKAKC
jgi:hypothetical protein